MSKKKQSSNFFQLRCVREKRKDESWKGKKKIAENEVKNL